MNICVCVLVCGVLVIRCIYPLSLHLDNIPWHVFILEADSLKCLSVCLLHVSSLLSESDMKNVDAIKLITRQLPGLHSENF